MCAHALNKLSCDIAQECNTGVQAVLLRRGGSENAPVCNGSSVMSTELSDMGSTGLCS